MNADRLRKMLVTSDLWGGRKEAAGRSKRSGPFDAGEDFHAFTRELREGEKLVGYESACLRRFLLADDLVTEARGRNALSDWLVYICDTCLHESMARFPRQAKA